MALVTGTFCAMISSSENVMSNEQNAPKKRLVELTAGLVSAYIINNNLSSSALPELISSVYGVLAGLLTPAASSEADKPRPSVPVRKSITPDYLISLEDGQPYKSLKRHLGRRGLTPAQYRMKWGLPEDYPMVAPNYSAQRSKLAKAFGLGRKGEEAADPTRAEAAPKAKPRSRKAA